MLVLRKSTAKALMRLSDRHLQETQISSCMRPTEQIQYIFDNHNILRIDSFPERDNVAKRVFENVKMSVCILFLQSGVPTRKFELYGLTEDEIAIVEGAVK